MKAGSAVVRAFVSGLVAGGAAGLLSSVLFTPAIAAAYPFSMLVYGLGGGVTAAVAVAALARLTAPQNALRLVSIAWIAFFLFFVLVYWGNKSLLPATPFRSGKSLALDFGALVISVVCGVALTSFLTRMARRPAVLAGITLLLIALPLAALIALIRGGLSSFDPADPSRPSVLLVSIDTMRADHVGCYGYGRETSPFIDSLAAVGIRFDQAICPVPQSSPSHASMLTGQAPYTHGVRENGYHLDDRVTTVAEYFEAAGYLTGGFVTNLLLGKQFGFSQGFQTYVESGQVEKLSRPRLSMLWQTLALKEIIDRIRYEFAGGVDQTLLVTHRWLDKVGDRPFFLFFHLLDPHAPYAPPEPYRSMFPVEPGRVAEGDWTDAGKDPLRLASNISLYDGEIAAADAKLKELFDHLRRIDRVNNLIVVVTSDHGENLGDHEPYFRHEDVYDSVLRVPLIVLYPGMVARGTVIGEIAQNHDIVPTVLSLAGLEGETFDGEDWTPLMEGEREEDSLRLALCRHGRRYALRGRDWKMTHNLKTGERKLFDLRQDPGERIDRSSDDPDRLARMDEQLLALIAEVEPEDLTGDEGRELMNEMDSETRERLRALGYLD